MTAKASLTVPCLLTIACLWAASLAPARAQNSSLFRQDDQAAQALTLANSSWTYEGAELPRVFKLNDLLTVLVQETSQVTQDANLQRRKQGQLNEELRNWVRLDGLNLVPSNGDQHINGTLQGQFRAQSNLDTRDLMKFSIEARVVDIRPNGHLVLEAHQSMNNNEERWERTLSGIIRPEDVLPNNTILSEKIAELSIHKKEQGQVRDGYRRGWLFYLIDRYGLF